MKQPSKDLVRLIREKFGLSQTQAAEQIGMSLRTWQRIEYGQNLMPIPAWNYFLCVNIGKLASMLGIED